MLFLRKRGLEIESTSRLVKVGDVAGAMGVDQIFDEARREGYAKGRDEADADAAHRKLRLVEESTEFLASFESKLTDLVLRVLRKCMDVVPAEELVANIAAKALNEVAQEQRRIVVRVCPSAFESVNGRVADIRCQYPSVETLEVIADEKLDPRACVVETAAGVLDASVDVQLAEIEKSLARLSNADERNGEV